MAISLIISTAAVGTKDTVTTSAVDTTGANLIVIGLGFNFDAAPLTISDSKSNTWTALTVSGTAGNVGAILYYCANPTVGSGHTFSSTKTSSYSTIFIQAFGGVQTSSPFDLEGGATNSATTIQPGSITPSQNNEVIITMAGFNGACTPVSIDSSFIETNELNFGGANNYGGEMAYLIQTTASTVNPTVTRTNSNASAIRIAIFKQQSSITNYGLFGML